MSGPQTPWELTGKGTTTPAELTFLEQIAAETPATLADFGTSAGGHRLWYMEIGNPAGQTVLIASNQHGNEPASREAALILIRDLAYTTDATLLAYLAEHRVVIVPAVNRDGTIVFSRLNGNGVDLNRDWWKLTQPETVALMELMHACDPILVVDAHEASNDGGFQWRPFAAGLPGEHPLVTATAQSAVDAGSAALAPHGWVTGDYPHELLPWAGLSTVVGAQHRIGVLSETVVNLPFADRVAIQRTVLGEFLDWHRTHTADLTAARTASRQLGMTATSVPVPTRTYIGGGPVTMAHIDHGYVLTAPLPDWVTTLHSVTAEDLLVPLRQESWLAVAALLDPESAQRVAFAYRDAPPAESVGPSLRVKDDDGTIRAVIEVWQKTDGTRHRVSEILTKQGGIIRHL